MAKMTVKLQVRKPWWAGLYICALILLHALGFKLDIDKVAARIAAGFRYRAGQKGRFRRISDMGRR